MAVSLGNPQLSSNRCSRRSPFAVWCLSYMDAYWLLAIASAVMFVGSFALKANKPEEGGETAVQ